LEKWIFSKENFDNHRFSILAIIFGAIASICFFHFNNKINILMNHSKLYLLHVLFDVLPMSHEQELVTKFHYNQFRSIQEFVKIVFSIVSVFGPILG